MAQVSVTISGKVYRMACGDGEEAHLEALAVAYDARIAEMHAAFGEIGDMRLHVMAALSIADDSAGLRKRVEQLEQSMAAASGNAGSADARAGDIELKAAAAISEAARRIERIAKSLGGSGAG